MATPGSCLVTSDCPHQQKCKLSCLPRLYPLSRLCVGTASWSDVLGGLQGQVWQDPGLWTQVHGILLVFYNCIQIIYNVVLISIFGIGCTDPANFCMAKSKVNLSCDHSMTVLLQDQQDLWMQHLPLLLSSQAPTSSPAQPDDLAMCQSLHRAVWGVVPCEVQGLP